MKVEHCRLGARPRDVSFLALSLSGMLSMLFPAFAHAEVIVTEIMYNPVGANVGHQWVEVTNTGSDSVDLGAKTIRFFDGSGDHVIKPYGTGDTSIGAGTSAVIAQNPLTFLNDYPNYVGTLLRSSFTLTASGILGITQTDGDILDKVSYTSAQGAKGDSNSLQRIQKAGGFSAEFIAGAPTPGVYPLTPPAALIAPVKQIATSKSSSKGTKRAKAVKTVTSRKYGKGTVAPVDSADAASAGVMNGDLPDFSFSLPSFSMPAFVTPYIRLLSSAWFASFLALLGFSAFSLLVIQRQYNL